jgi:hypothetical protein
MQRLCNECSELQVGPSQLNGRSLRSNILVAGETVVRIIGRRCRKASLGTCAASGAELEAVIPTSNPEFVARCACKVLGLFRRI